MKAPFNNKSIYLITSFILGYIIGCWSSVILVFIIASIFILYKGDFSKINKYKNKALPVINEIKYWAQFNFSNTDTTIKTLELKIQSQYTPICIYFIPREPDTIAILESWKSSPNKTMSKNTPVVLPIKKYK